MQLPDVARRQPLAREANTVRLAVESWLDGCGSEGRAAAQAAAAAERAADPATRAMLARIASDEQRHAELAWAILRWALQAGGADARDAVHELGVTAEPAVAHEHAAAGLEAHGRLAADTLNAVARDHARNRARLRSALSA